MCLAWLFGLGGPKAPTPIARGCKAVRGILDP